MEKLYDRLVNYSKDDYYPMHMPGHKRNTAILPMVNPYAIDITEIPGFDNLNQPEEILQDLSNRICRIYQSNRAFPLVNGSTVGILAGISAATHRGDRVLVARNCHKSVYHAIALLQLQPVYIYPQTLEELPINGGILAENLEEMLIKHADIKLVIITSPTYEGVVSDIGSIAEVVHAHGAILLVDEAHGSHFGFHEKFPKSAVTCGADLVVQSFHKTLPAFTQTAVLHSNLPRLNQRIRKFISIYQSSSPSYILIAGIDRCITLLEELSEILFDKYYQRLELFYQSVNQLRYLKILTGDIIGRYGIYDLDPSKVTVFTANSPYNGHQLGKILLEKYHIVMEMESRGYILGITSICDTQEGLERFANALLEIDQQLSEVQRLPEEHIIQGNIIKNPSVLTRPVCKMNPYEAMEQETEVIPLAMSSGRICAEIITQYPPGIPLLVPGEVMNNEIIHIIQQAIKDGFTIAGLLGDEKDRIEVIK